MKNLKNNKKGFTLIELLAVIVILAILVAVAVPAVMRYLASSRKDTFASNANQAISAVRNDVAFSGPNAETIYYKLDEINNLLDKKLNTSPYGGTFTKDSYVMAKKDAGGVYSYSICLEDGDKNVIALLSENNTLSVPVPEADVKGDNVTTGTDSMCTISGDDVIYAHTQADGSRSTYNTTVPSTNK